jgi:heterodisulfide reductase subunit C/uncharacterized membrane protein
MHLGVSNIIFLIILIGASGLFTKNLLRIRRNILLGRDIDRTDNSSKRWSTLIRVALGQGKMVTRPVAGFLHILVYVGFLLINIEVLEIVLDGIFGTHRLFAFMGGSYNMLIAIFEVLAFLVLVSCAIFLVRRNVMNIRRFGMREMKGWPKSDANLILIFEILLMSALLTMNASDALLQAREYGHYITAGTFPISQFIQPALAGLPDNSLFAIERITWWFHIVGILGFLNYIIVSKHLHIVFAFPNTYYSNLDAKGRFTNMESVTAEVKMMMDPNADPFAADAGGDEENAGVFGAKDATDLNWVQLMNAYTCTECGRCSSECPANLTGKKLSPRKIMMDTRDRIEEIGSNLDKHGKDYSDGKSLLDDYISREEIWACTSCNACTQACPVNIDPLSIILDLRRYAVMEESSAPTELNMMFTNVENNGAPWQMPATDRLNWAEEE